VEGKSQGVRTETIVGCQLRLMVGEKENVRSRKIIRPEWMHRGRKVPKRARNKLIIRGGRKVRRTKTTTK